MSTTEVKNAPTSEQPKPTETENKTASSESPNTAKKSYKGALTKEQQQASEEPVKQTENTTTTESTTASEADSTNETRKPRASSKSKSVNLNSKPAWKNHKKKATKEEEGEVLADPQAWPTLDQVSTTQTAPKEKKKDSPREETKELQNSNSTESKKKSANWVPLPIEVQTRSSSNSAPRRGRGGMRNGQSHQNNNNANSSSNQPQQQQSHQNNRGNWRKPNTRGGNSMRGGRGGSRGGYNNSYAPGAVVYYPPPVEGESLKGALLWQVEYYFSVENLCKDLYLRQQMDEEGWIPLSVISNFNRIKYLTSDLPTLIETIKTSTVVEFNDDKIRKKEDWKTWLIPKGSTQ